MYHIILFHDFVMSLTTFSVQLHIYATNCVAKCVHPNTAVTIKNQSFSVFSWHGHC